jgi:DNA-binding response OmpR family regulator
MKKRILLIEDNKEISENIKEYLELEDFEVVQAFDGERGIERATREAYDLILLDLMLPEVDGISIARRVRLKRDVPVIMITARESLSDRLLGFEV